MSFKEKLQEKLPIFFIIMAILLVFNFLGTCNSANRTETSSNNIQNEISDLKAQISEFQIQLNEITKINELTLEDKFLEFSINQQKLANKDIKAEELQKRQQIILKELRKIKVSQKESKK